MNKKNIIFNILLFIFFVLVTALTLWRVNPGVLDVPGTDSGIYLYMGRQILDGKILYRDVWDHKAPLIFYINAFSLLISNNSWWGICILQLIWLSITATLCYHLLRKSIGFIPAFSISIGVIIGFYYVGGDNFPETYSVLFSFVALLCFIKMRASEKSGRWGFLMGLAFAGSFMIRPNLVATWAAIGLFYIVDWILFPKKYSIQYFILPILGAVLGVLACLGPSIVNGAFGNFWDAVFKFNFNYAADKLIVSRFDAFIGAMNMLRIIYGLFALIPLGLLIHSPFYFLKNSKIRLLVIKLIDKCFYIFLLISLALIIQPILGLNRTNLIYALMGASVLTISLIARSNYLKRYLAATDRQEKSDFQITDLEVIGGISFILEVIIVILAGRSFNHYFATFIPSLCILFGAAIRILNIKIARIPIFKTPFKLVINLTLILFFLISPLAGVIKDIKTGLPLVLNNGQIENVYANEYLLTHTSETDTALFWGRITTNVNFSSGRDAPGIYSYVLPLYQSGYCDEENVKVLMKEYEKNPPKLIVISKSPSLYYSYPLVLPSQIEKFGIDIISNPCVVYLKPLFEFIDQNYVLSDTIHPIEWAVYTKKS